MRLTKPKKKTQKYTEFKLNIYNKTQTFFLNCNTNTSKIILDCAVLYGIILVLLLLTSCYFATNIDKYKSCSTPPFNMFRPYSYKWNCK